MDEQSHHALHLNSRCLGGRDGKNENAENCSDISCQHCTVRKVWRKTVCGAPTEPPARADQIAAWRWSRFPVLRYYDYSDILIYLLWIRTYIE